MQPEMILKNLPALFAALLVAILFIQSGLDKVFDWKGNMDWLTGHFSKTFLSGFVWIMLAPAAGFLGLLVAYPICLLVYNSFFTVDLMTPDHRVWVGLGNYIDALTSDRIRESAVRTLQYEWCS